MASHNIQPRRARAVVTISTLLLAGAGAGVAAPANAASAPLNYTCTTVAGDKPFLATIDTNVPATLAYGQHFTPRVSAVMTLPSDIVGLIEGFLGGSSVDGTVDLGTVLDGVPQTMSATIPLTMLPADSSATPVTATGVAPAPLTGDVVGKTHTIAVADFTANLTFSKADGTTAYGPANIPCTLDANQNATVDTFTVVKDATTSLAKSVYTGSTKSAKVTDVVKSTHGTIPTGRVSFTLKKGTKVLKTVAASLSAQGVATTVFKGLRVRGAYTVVSKYLGSANHKPSQASSGFKF